MSENSSKDTSNIELHSAVKKNKSERISELIKNGCDINAKDPSSSDNTALHIASATGNLPIVKLLIEEGKADINVQNSYKDTPLILAINNKHFDVAQHLVEKDADINAANQNGNTPISYAVALYEKHADAENANKYSDIIKYMLGKQVTENKVDVDKVISLDKEHVKYYIYPVVNSDFPQEYYDNKVKRIHESLKKLSPDEFEKNTVIALSFNKGKVEKACHYNKVDKLSSTFNEIIIDLTNRAEDQYVHTDTNIKESANSLVQAIIHNDLDKFKAGFQNLITSGVDIDTQLQYNATLLHLAAYYGKLEIARYLIEQGADINVQNQIGYTPLHSTAHAKADNLDISQLLTTHNNTGIDIKSNNGYTSLHLAARHGHVNMVDDLITKGANVHIENCYGHTPLHLAVMHGHKNIVERLITKDADINAVDINKDTPLHLAVKALLDIANQKNKMIADLDYKFIAKQGESILYILNDVIGAPPNYMTRAGSIFADLIKKDCSECIEKHFDQNSSDNATFIAKLLLNIAYIQNIVIQNYGSNNLNQADVARDSIHNSKKILDALDAMKGIVEKNSTVNTTDKNVDIFARTIIHDLLNLTIQQNEVITGNNDSYKFIIDKIYTEQDIVAKTMKYLIKNNVNIHESKKEALFDSLSSAIIHKTQFGLNQYNMLLDREKGIVDIVKYLVQEGADMNKENNAGHTYPQLISQYLHKYLDGNPAKVVEMSQDYYDCSNDLVCENPIKSYQIDEGKNNLIHFYNDKGEEIVSIPRLPAGTIASYNDVLYHGNELYTSTESKDFTGQIKIEDVLPNQFKFQYKDIDYIVNYDELTSEDKKQVEADIQSAYEAFKAKFGISYYKQKTCIDFHDKKELVEICDKKLCIKDTHGKTCIDFNDREWTEYNKLFCYDELSNNIKVYIFNNQVDFTTHHALITGPFIVNPRSVGLSSDLEVAGLQYHNNILCSKGPFMDELMSHELGHVLQRYFATIEIATLNNEDPEFISNYIGREVGRKNCENMAGDKDCTAFFPELYIEPDNITNKIADSDANIDNMSNYINFWLFYCDLLS
ncbi:hypothetical protein BIY23_00090 [Wolbachia pipientis]|uniref:Uncharacterized protein n=1 Tax=Wolbachia pipientis TaxID=955 RepID=A0A1E7QL08_WOLPI|nr:ankyrin repeat domain-containing protein [Wolbachia pipientis]OEY86899.1 hypothetical protein BIY23_00090 [Wolbachia pipientis]